jgi:hypothetical protein
MVVIVLKQGSHPIDASTFPKFVGLIVIVESQDESTYRVGTICRGALPTGPHVPSLCVFPHNHAIRDFLQCKVINFYRSALYYPAIGEAIDDFRRRYYL